MLWRYIFIYIETCIYKYIRTCADVRVYVYTFAFDFIFVALRQLEIEWAFVKFVILSKRWHTLLRSMIVGHTMGYIYTIYIILYRYIYVKT